MSGTDPGAAHPGSWPDDIAGDAAGNVWFAMHHADELGRMSPDGTYTGYRGPTRGSEMDSIAVDDVRRIVWVSQVAGNNIVRFDMDTGRVAEIPVPTPSSFPGDMALGADGTLWFVEGYDSTVKGSGRLAKVNPDTNVVTEIPLAAPRDTLDGILVDRTGAVWFTEFFENRLGRYAGGVVTEVVLPRPGSVPTNVALDQSGRIWVTEQGTNAIGVYNPTSGLWNEYPIPSRGAYPAGVAVDASGNVWFTETLTNKIGLIEAGSDRIQEFTIPTPDSYPEDIRVIRGRIVFTERYGNKIGEIAVPGVTP